MSQKLARIEQSSGDMASFAYRRYGLADAACVMMWREFYLLWCERTGRLPPEWARDSADVHRSMKQYAARMRAILEAEYGVVVCMVNNNIRRYISHGEPPRRDDSVRTDQWYRTCIPSAKNPRMGLASFPNDTYQDHPLLTQTLARQSTTATTMLKRQVDRIDTASTRGLISKPRRLALVANITPDVQYISEHVQRPLLEGPQQ